MKTIRHIFLPVLALLAMTITGCQKKPANPEDALVVITNPANNSVTSPAPGPNFELTVTITSPMPPKGVKIDVAAHPDGSGTNFYSSSVNSTSSNNSFTITNTPQSVTCVTQITVTSLGSSSNKWTSSYRYSRK